MLPSATIHIIKWPFFDGPDDDSVCTVTLLKFFAGQLAADLGLADLTITDGNQFDICK